MTVGDDVTVPTSNDATSRGRLRAHWFEASLGFLALGAFALRAYYVATVRAIVTTGAGDELYFYWWPAQQLARGRGYLSPLTMAHCSWNRSQTAKQLFRDIPDHLFAQCQAIPSAKHPPGFVTFLAVLDKLGFESMNAQRYWVCAIGAATVVLLGLLVAKLVSRRAGIIAAAIATVYPNIWINDTLLMSETLMCFGFVLGLVGVYAFRRRPHWTRIAVASVGFTIATSARSESIVLFVAIIVPLVLARTHLKLLNRLGLLVVAAIVPLAMLVPWSVYNANRFEKPVYLSTGLGPTALASTCNHTYYTANIGYYDLSCMNGAPTAEPKGEGLDESQVNSVDKQKAKRYAKAHPARTALSVFAREARIVGLWHPRQQNDFDHYVQGRGSLALVATAQWSFWALALLSFAGAWIWRKRRIALYPLVAEMALTAVIVAVTFGNTRYRAAVEWCVVALAATAIDAAITRFTRYRGGQSPSDVPFTS